MMRLSLHKRESDSQRIGLGFGLLVGAGLLAQAAPLKEWQDPQLTGLNNLPMHATMVVCPDAATASAIELAKNNQRERSPWYRSLNGEWRYRYARNHTGRVPGF